MEWYDSYNIGIDQIDDQHQELVAMVTRIQRTLSSGGVAKEVGNALKFLVDYTRRHFSDEEKVMQAIDYEGLAHHKELHQKLIEDITRILIDLKKGKSIEPYAFVDFLTDWLMNHIRYEDKKIGKALADRQALAAVSAAPAPVPPVQE